MRRDVTPAQAITSVEKWAELSGWNRLSVDRFGLSSDYLSALQGQILPEIKQLLEKPYLREINHERLVQLCQQALVDIDCLLTLEGQGQDKGKPYLDQAKLRNFEILRDRIAEYLNNRSASDRLDLGSKRRFSSDAVAHVILTQDLSPSVEDCLQGMHIVPELDRRFDHSDLSRHTINASSGRRVRSRKKS